MNSQNKLGALARIFQTRMGKPTLRRVRARGLQERICAVVGRVPSRGAFFGVRLEGEASGLAVRPSFSEHSWVPCAPCLPWFSLSPAHRKNPFRVFRVFRGSTRPSLRASSFKSPAGRRGRLTTKHTENECNKTFRVLRVFRGSSCPRTLGTLPVRVFSVFRGSPGPSLRASSFKSPAGRRGRLTTKYTKKKCRNSVCVIPRVPRAKTAFFRANYLEVITGFSQQCSDSAKTSV